MVRHQHKRTEHLPLPKKLVLKKGQIDRRIIGRLIEDGREFTLHATKGYRRSPA